MARALIARPELLCLHKPLKPYDYILTNNLVGVFREFCRGKGLEEPEEERPYRRPRTCIFTENSACRAWGADHIFMVQIFKVVYWYFEALVVGSSITLMQFGVDPHFPHSSSLPSVASLVTGIPANRGQACARPRGGTPHTPKVPVCGRGRT